MKKTKLLLPALTLSMLGTAIGGGCLVAAAAEPQPRTGPTVGEFHTWDPYAFNGTSETAAENKTTISYKWETSGGYTTRVTVENYTSGNLELSMTSEKDAKVRLALISVGGWAVYGSDLIAENTALAASTEYTYSGDLAANLDGVTSFDLIFWFDANTVTTEKNTVTINSLTVGGVSYTPTKYTAPVGPVVAPETSFKAYTDWTATNGTLAANTLDKLTGDAAEGAVDNGAGNFTITDLSAPAALEIPLSEPLTGWPEEWTFLHVKVKANNVTQINAYIESSANCDESEGEDAHAFCFGFLGAWNATVTNSVSDGYRCCAINLGTYFSGYLASELHESITKIVLVPVVKEGATEASLEFGGMTFGGKDAPTFINDIGTPKLEIGEWSVANGGTYTVEQNGELEVDENTKYTGVKATYTAEQASTWSYTVAGVSNYDVAKAPYLHIGFYNDTELKLGVWGGPSDAPADLTGEGHKVYPAGYHEIEIDLTEKGFSGAISLMFYIDSSAANTFEGTKNIVFDSIVFHQNVSLAIGDATTNGLFKKPTVTDGKLSWSWDAKDAGAFYAVSVPVDNWHSFDRVLHVNVTLSHETAFGVWGKEAFTDNVLQNSTHPKLAAGTYDLWLSTSTAGLIEDGINNVMFYCDVNNASASSLVKTVTINKIEFVSVAEVTSSPNGKNITVNYLEQKVTFEAAYEVATDKDFTNKLASGATVTPGATLYLRAADGSSATTAVTLPSTAISKDSVPKATVGENFIRLSGAGYEFKLGADGTWTAANGSWANLTADTEYTVYVRVKATESAFASEAVELKIKTSAAQKPEEKPDEKPEEKPTDEKKSGCGSIIGLGSLGVAALAAMAVGAAVIVKKKKD